MRSILLIDDNNTDVENIKQELQKLDVKHTLRLASSGTEGLEILTGKKEVLPDLVLIDMNAPKMNGFEFLKVIKSYHRLRDIKVYVLTAAAEEYDKMLVKNLGGEGYIVKPLKFSGQGRKPESVKKLKNDLG
jgi:CheY-like chemotaxis protein